MLSPQAGIAAPTLTIKQGFEAKKRLLRVYFPTLLFTPQCSIPRNRNPSANRTRVRWLEAEHDNHYTVLLAKMQWQNVVFNFKPNVWEGNRGSRLNVARYVTCAWVASTGKWTWSGLSSAEWLGKEDQINRAKLVPNQLVNHGIYNARKINMITRINKLHHHKTKKHRDTLKLHKFQQLNCVMIQRKTLI